MEKVEVEEIVVEMEVKLEETVFPMVAVVVVVVLLVDIAVVTADFIEVPLVDIDVVTVCCLEVLVENITQLYESAQLFGAPSCNVIHTHIEIVPKITLPVLYHPCLQYVSHVFTLVTSGQNPDDGVSWSRMHPLELLFFNNA
eukprot:m.297735 g.297735  ORF g.297735 m.297735 type:complete len:142 (+) comp16403_c4_seq10:1331-1756(+)